MTRPSIPHVRKRNSHIYPRDPNDFYLEPTWVSRRLFDTEPFDRGGALLDPRTGTGRIADAAKAAGYCVLTADIVDRGYPDCRIENFLDRKLAPSSIVGNPPFDSVELFARHAFDIDTDKVALLFPTARLNAAHWLCELPLRRILLLTPRLSIPTGSHVLTGGKVGGGRTDFSWLVFERSYSGAPEVRWLHRDGILHRSLTNA